MPLQLLRSYADASSEAPGPKPQDSPQDASGRFRSPGFRTASHSGRHSSQITNLLSASSQDKQILVNDPYPCRVMLGKQGIGLEGCHTDGSRRLRPSRRVSSANDFFQI